MRVTGTAALGAAVLGVLAGLAIPAGPAFADSTRDNQWWIKSLSLTAVHKVTQGEGITVAVVDSGVDADHPDLKGNVLDGGDYFDEKTKGHLDRHGHGTGMASLIAGHGHGPGGRNGVLGIAPKAKILPVKVQAKNGIVKPATVAAGMNYAINKGADVINVSMSSGTDQGINDAVERAFRKNILVIAAVGNTEDSIIAAPANIQNTIAVSGIDKTGKISREHIPAQETKIAAPGQDMIQAAPGGGYVIATGTSTATAVVSGAVALIRAAHPDMTALEIAKQLLETTRDAGPKGPDEDFGYGTLDLAKAVSGQADGRIAALNKTEEPTPPPTAYYDEVSDDTNWTVVAIVVGIWVAIFAVIGGLIFLLVRRIKRKRRARQVAATPDYASVGAPPGPRGPADTTPARDDTAWRQP